MLFVFICKLFQLKGFIFLSVVKCSVEFVVGQVLHFFFVNVEYLWLLLIDLNFSNMLFLNSKKVIQHLNVFMPLT